jgi:hypothetical protein
VIRFLLPLFLMIAVGCAVKRDQTRNEWLEHRPTAWRTTPGGHLRDAGPFQSVAQGFTTEEEIDAAVDYGYSHFRELFPGLSPKEHKITLNDDYVMWIPQSTAWVSGVEFTGGDTIGVCIWTRANAAADPGKYFIKRPPGTYWEENYSTWRYTDKPLCPAIIHELLHSVIGDGGHKDPRWKLIQ